MVAIADRLRDIAQWLGVVSREVSVRALTDLADEMDGGDVQLGSNPWRLVIDQVMHLAVNVYGLSVDPPTTPEQVCDLWEAVVVEIAESARVIERDMAVQLLRDVERERDAYREASDQWHLLTEALHLDLRIDADTEGATADEWQRAAREALWNAYGIGRRHQRDNLIFRRTFRDRVTPFNVTETEVGLSGATAVAMIEGGLTDG